MAAVGSRKQPTKSMSRLTSNRNTQGVWVKASTHAATASVTRVAVRSQPNIDAAATWGLGPRPLIEPTPDDPSMPQDSAPLRDWKARAVRHTFADWPGAIAWVEDGFLPEARAWAAARLAQGRRTWLVDVSETGLTEEITQYLLEWAEER